jgi:hypothetical protein
VTSRRAMVKMGDEKNSFVRFPLAVVTASTVAYI